MSEDIFKWWLGLKLSIKFCALPFFLWCKGVALRILITLAILGIVYYSAQDMREGWRDDQTREESVKDEYGVE